VNYVGIDLHKMESQICIFTADGKTIEQRIRTGRERFGEFLNPYRPARVLLEAATESEWVARCLEEHGHEVVVADPNFGPMYAHRSQRIKTDRRDARALAEACRHDTFKRAHRMSAAQRQVQSELVVRDALVRTRTRHISVVRAQLRREGLRMRSGNANTFCRRVGELALGDAAQRTLAPALAVIELMDEQIRIADERIAGHAKGNPICERLQTVPGIGPLTAVAFIATLDVVGRFENAHQVQAYLGLVPRERSSGEVQRRGRLTKRGNARMRWLLVETAWRVIRSQKPAVQPLKSWAVQIAARRGRKIGAVALARRLAGILYALWRDDSDFDVNHRRRTQP